MSQIKCTKSPTWSARLTTDSFSKPFESKTTTSKDTSCNTHKSGKNTECEPSLMSRKKTVLQQVQYLSNRLQLGKHVLLLHHWKSFRLDYYVDIGTIQWLFLKLTTDYAYDNKYKNINQIVHTLSSDEAMKHYTTFLVPLSDSDLDSDFPSDTSQCPICSFDVFLYYLLEDQTKRFESVEQSVKASNVPHGSPLSVLFLTFSAHTHAYTTVKHIAHICFTSWLSTTQSRNASTVINVLEEVKESSDTIRYTMFYSKKYGVQPRMDITFTEDACYTVCVNHLDGVCIGKSTHSVLDIAKNEACKQAFEYFLKDNITQQSNKKKINIQNNKN